MINIREVDYLVVRSVQLLELEEGEKIRKQTTAKSAEKLLRMMERTVNERYRFSPSVKIFLYLASRYSYKVV